MTAWYGESYALDWGSVIAGTPWTTIGDLSYHFDSKHHNFVSGDSVIIGSYLDSSMSSEFSAFTGSIEARWVFEILGGSGEFRLHAGLDPTEAYNNTSYATQSLGTFAVSGAQTLVTDPIAGVDKTLLTSYSSYPIVWIECISGSVDVRQVKMRVWPTDGPSGGWRRASGYTDTVGATSYIHTAAGGYSAHYFDASVAWDEGVSIFDGTDGATLDLVGAPMEWRPPSTAGQNGWSSRFDVQHDSAVGLDDPDMFAYVETRSQVFVPDVPAAASSVPVGGTYVDPREVRRDTAAKFRAVGGGNLVASVSGWNPVNVTNVNGGYIAHEMCSFTPGVGAPSTLAFNAPAITGSPTSMIYVPDGGAATFVPSAAGPFVITSYPAIYFSGDVGLSSVSGRVTGGVTAIIAYPEYEWFDPTLPWGGGTPHLFVTVAPVTGDPRDASHSVGIGKRAADVSIFKIHPTPHGTYRELRPGESVSDVSAAWPLKVLLYDGSFATVAWMTLDP